jgi:hypothetical protein
MLKGENILVVPPASPVKTAWLPLLSGSEEFDWAEVRIALQTQSYT